LEKENALLKQSLEQAKDELQSTLEKDGIIKR